MTTPPPAHGQQFEAAIAVTPLNKPNHYSAFLRDEWCIGTVPHGGYTSAILYRLALVHFAHAHPSLYKDEPATPISMQLTFLRRTSAGPATLTVSDMKLGRRTSCIRIELLQSTSTSTSGEGEKNGTAEEGLEVKVAGYITVSPDSVETGLSSPTDWSLYPAPPAGTGVGGAVDFAALVRTGRDGGWERVETPFAGFRRAARQVEIYGVSSSSGSGRKGIVDQWARLRVGGELVRWSNEAVVFLVDMFPMALDGFDTAAVAAAGLPEDATAKFWYPTVTLNVDLKSRVPESGTEWLYSRVVTKKVSNGRTDLDVTVLDEKGEIVALSTQVGLVVSASRNIGRRQHRI